MRNIDKALAMVDALLSISVNAAIASQKYNAMVSLARSETREITDEELAQLDNSAEVAKARAQANRPSS